MYYAKNIMLFDFAMLYSNVLILSHPKCCIVLVVLRCSYYDSKNPIPIKLAAYHWWQIYILRSCYFGEHHHVGFNEGTDRKQEDYFNEELSRVVNTRIQLQSFDVVANHLSTKKTSYRFFTLKIHAFWSTHVWITYGFDIKP